MVALITWLWQGLAIAAATAALLACARTLNAASRHACWWLACAAVLMLPAAYLLAAGSPEPAAAAVPVPTPPDFIWRSALLAWAIFSGAGLIRVVSGICTVRRLKESGEPLDRARPALSPSSARGRHPQLRISDDVTGACALGLGRPVILLSRALVEALDDEELDAIVLHEQAHLERHDDRWQLVHGLVLAMAGWHPAVRLIGRRIALEREAACDDYVVARTGSTRTYARALARAAVIRSGFRAGAGFAAIPGAIASRSALRARIERLLNPDLERGWRVARGVAIAATAALPVAVAAAVSLPAVVMVVDAVVALPRVTVPRTAPVRTEMRPPAAPASMGSVRSRQGAVVYRVPAVVETLQPAASPDQPGLEVRAVTEQSASAALAPLESTQTAGVTLASALPPAGGRSPWSTLARSAATAGQAIGRSGAATGDRARDAGVSIGRFFTRTSKAVAAGF